MNIKPDDKLAVQIKSRCGNEGAVVEVLQFLGVRPFYAGSFWFGGAGPCWLVRYPRPTRTSYGKTYTEMPCADTYLKPLRNNPGNESWFTAAPRSKPATTKQDTIDARGMVRS